MKSTRIFLAFTAAALALAACERTPTGDVGAPSASTRFNGEEDSSPPADMVRRSGIGTIGGGG